MSSANAEAVENAAQTARLGRRERWVSPATRNSIWMAAAILILLGGVDVLNSLGVIPGVGRAATVLITLVPLGVGIAMLPVVLSFGTGGTIRLQWIMFSSAMLSAGIGAVLWVTLYLLSGHDPFPSMADVFYTALYPLVLVGLVLAILGYRGIVRFRIPVIVASCVGIAGAAIVYLTVLKPFIFSASASQLSGAALALSIFNPLADCLLLLVPAVLLGLLVRQLGAGRIAWPWWMVVVAVILLAFGDSAYSYAKFAGITNTVFVDLGWMTAALLILVATNVARDVYAG